MKFSEIIQENKLYKYLEEKLIVVGGGKSYGQVIFLAGGAASGKGFARDNFLDANKFKVRDVDEWKSTFMKIDKLKQKYPEIRGLDLKKPKDVYKLHMFVDKIGVKDKTLTALLTNAEKGRLPNIMFDVTMKNLSSLDKPLQSLEEIGYDAKNIHLVWVLANYHVAVQANKDRARVVPDDILLQTHEGAAATMGKIISKGMLPKFLDGGIYIILNNRDQTKFWVDKDGKPIKNTKGEKVIKQFTYAKIKDPGKPLMNEKDIKKQIYNWVVDNVPKTVKSQFFD